MVNPVELSHKVLHGLQFKHDPPEPQIRLLENKVNGTSYLAISLMSNAPRWRLRHEITLYCARITHTSVFAVVWCCVWWTLRLSAHDCYTNVVWWMK